MENDTTSGFMLCPNDGMRFPVAKSRFVSMHTLARSQQGKNKSQRKEQVRKGGLPALSDGLSCWDHSGGKPPFLTCSFPADLLTCSILVFVGRQFSDCDRWRLRSLMAVMFRNRPGAPQQPFVHEDTFRTLHSTVESR
jgi:hypothetical protein